MNCQQTRLLLEAHADGELDAANILELERHINDCAECAHASRNIQALKTALKGEAVAFSAPRDLRLRLENALRDEAGVKPWWREWKWPSLTLASSTLAAACAVALTMAVLRPSPPGLAQEVVDNHIRSMMANHIMDVASTDQHTVKPWFNGKLDFAPPVKDLATDEFPLVGGRLDYLEGHTVAALVFHRNKHVINLFIWPTSAKDSSPAETESSQGYHLIHWNAGGMTFWAVSDLNGKELLDFANDYNRN